MIVNQLRVQMRMDGMEKDLSVIGCRTDRIYKRVWMHDHRRQ